MALDLLRWATTGWPEPARVLDPACGAGAFLEAARRLWPQAELVGLDIDPGAVAAARSARTDADIRLADALDEVSDTFDLVVGNPPFLGQLARATARDRSARERLRHRFGPAATGYVDTAALFLLAGLDAVRPGGRVVLIQPESVLGGAHTGPLRAAVEERADVLGLREVDRRAFDADVDTCALLLERTRGVSPHMSAPVTWSPLLAAARGVPGVRLDPGAGTIGDLATATAGFRQHHYALAAHVVEHEPGLDRIATTGLVDPGAVAWGERPARLGGRTWARPAVDLTGVAADDPSVASWFRARLRPKVLVAPQTRIVEAAVDADGAYLPATPLVAVEPRSDQPEATPWRVAAALGAPPVTAWALALTAGTARSRHALKLSARQALAVPLPVDTARWHAAADALRQGASPADVAQDMTQAYGLAPADPVLAWWRERA